QWNKTLSYNMANPLYDATTNSFSKTLGKNISNSLNLRWDMMKGLYSTASFSYTMTDSKGDRFMSPDRSMFQNENDPSKRGTYQINSSSGKSWQSRVGLTYNKNLWGDGSVLTFNVGASANRSNSANHSFSGMGFLKGS